MDQQNKNMNSDKKKIVGKKTDNETTEIICTQLYGIYDFHLI